MKKWLARDLCSGGHVWRHNERPYKDYNLCIWVSSDKNPTKVPDDQLPEGCNPKWDDKEPIEFEI